VSTSAQSSHFLGANQVQIVNSDEAESAPATDTRRMRRIITSVRAWLEGPSDPTSIEFRVWFGGG